MAVLVQPAAQEDLIEETVRAVPVPKGLRFDQIAFYDDHSGDPAIRITFKVIRHLPLSKARGNELADFMLAVQDKVRDLGTGRIPYVKFADVK